MDMIDGELVVMYESRLKNKNSTKLYETTRHTNKIGPIVNL